MIDVSGFGTKIQIVALQSFPMGFSLTQFADEENPLEVEPVEPTGFEMMYDGSLFSYDKASPIRVSVSVLPNSDDDINLKILLNNRKAGFKWLPIKDITTMVVTYPDGGRCVLTQGTILTGRLLDGVNSAGRKPSNTYTFAFGAFGGLQNSKQLAASVIQEILGFL